MAALGTEDRVEAVMSGPVCSRAASLNKESLP